MTSIELIRLGRGGADVAWDLGPSRLVAPDPRALADVEPAGAEAVLVLDAAFPLPDPALLERLLASPADAWHGGLALGLEGEPTLFDHVNPLWMLNLPLDPTGEVSSWRVSLRALLVRTAVLEQLGGPWGAFDTLAGAGLELGLRWTRAGALVRHVPDLVPPDATPDPAPTAADGLRLVARHHGRRWSAWGLARALGAREVGPVEALRLLDLARSTREVRLAHYRPPGGETGSTDRTVTVVVPTLDRYDHLERLLAQLAEQRVPPHQVVVVDQTPRSRRRRDLADVAPGLPLEVVEQDVAGQSTARNTALARATGELVLFLDDDDEIGPDLLADHLRRVGDGIDACCGGVDDATLGPPIEGFRHRRLSDVFPTNNTMVRRAALARSGLFDPAFDGRPMEDHDLGIRLHLGGALLVYDPDVLLYHHHAPRGGLRAHGTRAVTRASSRRSLTERNLPAVTELYLGHRYATPRQQREGRAIRLLGTLSGDGPRHRRLARFLVQLVLLPDTVRRLRRADRQAAALAAERRALPTLPSRPGVEAP